MKQLIDVLEARGNAGHLVLLIGETGNLLVGVAYQLIHLAERRADAFLGYVEERLLRLFHHLIQIIGRVIGQGINLRGGEHELAQNGLPLDDIDMALPAGEREGVVGQLGQIGAAAHSLQLPRGLQGVGESDGINGNVAVREADDSLEDDAMGRTEEVFRTQPHDRFFGHLPVEQAGGEHRLLGLDVLRQLRAGRKSGRIVGIHGRLRLVGHETSFASSVRLLYRVSSRERRNSAYRHCFTGNRLIIENGPSEEGPSKGLARRGLLLGLGHLNLDGAVGGNFAVNFNHLVGRSLGDIDSLFDSVDGLFGLGLASNDHGHRTLDVAVQRHGTW